jgi:hypothetical protein
VVRTPLLLGALLSIAGCSSGPRTQVLVEVDSDLFAPEELDGISVTARAPDERMQSAMAALGAGELPLPRVLAMAHGSGPLGPFALTVVGERDGVAVVERRATFSFVQDETRVLRVMLARSCIGETCGDDPGQTCAVGGCRSVEVGQGELAPWDGRPPPLDAATVDACVPDERCNGVDDDCDAATDEGFDLQTDESHCGGCAIRCATLHTTSSCESGACVIDACESGWGDCDEDASDGCETDTTSSTSHCGACGNVCRASTPDCCDGTCGRC